MNTAQLSFFGNKTPIVAEIFQFLFYAFVTASLPASHLTRDVRRAERATRRLAHSAGGRDGGEVGAGPGGERARGKQCGIVQVECDRARWKWAAQGAEWCYVSRLMSLDAERAAEDGDGGAQRYQKGEELVVESASVNKRDEVAGDVAFMTTVTGDVDITMALLARLADDVGDVFIAKIHDMERLGAAVASLDVLGDGLGVIGVENRATRSKTTIDDEGNRQ
ncbi:hypothetical protein DFH09DRAFT_1091412 [Mycena vulgaris]|nr:hypothetical protein DFH09DRAFT_1091412 [Mycena vulgaris]